MSKQEAIERLLKANFALPHLRLGQLITNALLEDMGVAQGSVGSGLFYKSDEDLVKVVEAYVERADKL